MNCNATLTTVTTTDDVVARTSDYNPATFYKVRWDTVISDGVATVRDGNRLMRLDVHEHTCILTDHDSRAGHINHDRVDITCNRLPDGLPHPTQVHLCECGLVWHDGVKGAASHADNTPPADVHRIKLSVGDDGGWVWSCECGATTAGYTLKSNAVMDADQHCKNHEPPADVCPVCGGTTNADKFSSGIDRDCPSCGDEGKGRA